MFKKSYQKNIPLLISSEVLAFFGITSLWVIYLAQSGMTMVEIGLLEGCFHATSFVAEIPSGALADRLSYRTNLLLSRLLGIISCLFMIFADSFWLFALGMVTSALCYNFDSGTSEALLFESVTAHAGKARFLKINSVKSALFELTFTLGAMVAGLFVHRGMSNIYWIQIALYMVSIALIILTKEPEEELKADRKKRQTFRLIFKTAYTTLKENQGLFEMMVISEVISTFLAVYYMYFQNEIQDLAGWQISLIMAVSAIFAAGFAWGSARIGKRFFIFKLLPFIITTSAILLMVTVTDHFAVSLATYLITGGFSAMLAPIFSNYFNPLIPSSSRATLISLTSMLYSLGMIIMFPVLGFLIEKIGFSHVFGGVGVLLMICALLVKNKLSEKF
jgi:MFS family permease